MLAGMRGNARLRREEDLTATLHIRVHQEGKATSEDADARAVHQRVLAKPGCISDQHLSSLDSGFFAMRPVLVFLWGASLDPELVASVERLVSQGGGKELEDNLKQALLSQVQLRQARRRWRALRSRRPRDGVMTKHQALERISADAQN